MDTTLIIIVAIAALFIVLYLLTRRPGATTETFDPDLRHDTVVTVNRRTTIVAPPQNGDPVQVSLDPLVGPPATPPPEKGLGDFVVEVINPRFTDANTQETLTKFSPPLTFTVNYTSDDMKGLGGMAADQTIRKTDVSLNLATYYLAEDGWRFEKLDTAVDTVAMTLTAQVSNLAPADPIGIFH